MIEVVAGIINHPDDPNRFLLAQRPYEKSLPGVWEFPGGKIRKDESKFNALKRELKEELHLVVANAREFKSFGGKSPKGDNLLLHFVLAKALNEPVATDEVQGWIWLIRDHVSSFNLAGLDTKAWNDFVAYKTKS